MIKIRLKRNEFEAIQFKEGENSLSEIKRFCGEYSKITYEYADGIGCYWVVQIDVSNTPDKEWKILPLCGWVVLNDIDGFKVYNDFEFKELFERLDGKDIPYSTQITKEEKEWNKKALEKMKENY